MVDVSIITICYNDIVGLKNTVTSIDKSIKDVQNFEHIIVDGNSSDGTADYLLKLVQSRKIDTRFISEPDEGIYDAMNKGIYLSKGKCLIFLNAGDLFHDDLDLSAFYSAIGSLVHSPSDVAGLAFDAIMKIGSKSFLINSRNVDPKYPRMPTIHQSMIFKKSVMKDFLFSKEFKICGDYDNFARIFMSGYIFLPVSNVLAVFCAGGVSSKYPLVLFKESLRVSFKEFNLGVSSKILLFFRLLLTQLILQVLLKIYL